MEKKVNKAKEMGHQALAIKLKSVNLNLEEILEPAPTSKSCFRNYSSVANTSGIQWRERIRGREV